MKRMFIVFCAVVSLSACDETTDMAPAITAVESKPTVCPYPDFETFLAAFASDPNVRDAYTAPMISVVDFKDPNELNAGTMTEQVPKAEYRDFTITHRSDAFHNVDAAGGVDPAPIDLDIEKRPDGYLVGYLYGMSEGNSWLFKKADRCWMLSSDPEPPSP